MTGPILDGFKGLLGIQANYVAYFNRPADVNGRVYWENAINAHQYQLQDLSASFSRSTEYKQLYEGKNSSQIVSTIYQNLFNRAPEAAGLEYWTSELDNGGVGIDNVAYAALTAAQNDDKSIIDNKLAAAELFTSRLAENDWGDKYKDAVLAQAREWLSQVDDNKASLIFAELTVDDVVGGRPAATQAEVFTFEMGYDPEAAGPSVNAHIIRNFDFGLDKVHLVGRDGQPVATNGPTYFHYADFEGFGSVAESDKDQFAIFSALGAAHASHDNDQLAPLQIGESVLIAYEVNGALRTVLFVDDTTSGDPGGANGPGSASWNTDADLVIDMTGIVGLKINPNTFTLDGDLFI